MQNIPYRRAIWIMTAIIFVVGMIHIWAMNGNWYEIVAVQGEMREICSFNNIMLKLKDAEDLAFSFLHVLLWGSINMIIVPLLILVIALAVSSKKGAAVAAIVLSFVLLLASLVLIPSFYGNQGSAFMQDKALLPSDMRAWIRDHEAYDLVFRPTWECYACLICPMLTVIFTTVRFVMVQSYRNALAEINGFQTKRVIDKRRKPAYPLY